MSIDDSDSDSSAPGVPQGPKVALVGDSVIAGLGVHGRSYGRLVAKHLGAAQTLQLARSTHTVLDALEKIDRLTEFEPDLIIVAVGGSDYLVHAGRGMQRLMDRFAPKSWQGVEGLEPRPWFAGTRAEQLKQRATTLAKVATKHIGIRLTGGYQRVPAPEFAEGMKALMERLDQISCQVVVIGLHATDERLFPRSNVARAPYSAAIAHEVRLRPSAVLVETAPLLSCWDDYLPDHAHLNEVGHAKVAAAIEEALSSRGVALTTAPAVDELVSPTA